jgi:hypothetical protein
LKRAKLLNLKNRYTTSNYKITTPFNQKNKPIIIQLMNGRPDKLNQRPAYSSKTIQPIGNQNVNDSGKPISLLSAHGNKATKQATQEAAREASPLIPMEPTVELSRSIEGLANTPSRATVNPSHENEYTESRVNDFESLPEATTDDRKTEKVVEAEVVERRRANKDYRGEGGPRSIHESSTYLAAFTENQIAQMPKDLQKAVVAGRTGNQTSKKRLNAAISAAGRFATEKGLIILEP